MTNPIRIKEPLKQICDLLGVPYDLTRLIKIYIRPREATVELYVINENGKKHIDPTTNDPVVERRTIKVLT